MKRLLIQAIFSTFLAVTSITVCAQPSLLPNRTLLHFSLTKSHDGVEIKGTLSGSHTYDSIIIERGDSPSSSYTMIAELPAGSNAGMHSFTYLDRTSGPGIYYYRVRLFNTTQNIQEISNTLMLKIIDESSNLKIYNTVLQSSNPSLSVYSIGNDEVNLQVADLSGHVFYNSTVRLNAGTNSINIDGLGTARGYFVVALKNKVKVITQKVILQ